MLLVLEALAGLETATALAVPKLDGPNETADDWGEGASPDANEAPDPKLKEVKDTPVAALEDEKEA